MTSHAIETAIRRTARRLGIDIRRHRPEISETGRLSAMLAAHDVNIVFDVGANVGQFALELRDAGYRRRLVSIEPISAARELLVRTSRNDPMWDVVSAAIGSEDGEIDINISKNSVSSSVLAMLDSHASAAPESKFVATERVPLVRLDTLARNYLTEDSVPFIKIDTQGYEDRVLLGAPQLLANAKGVQLELSLVPLYEGQQLFHSLLDRLGAMGFEIWAIWPGIYCPRNGRMLQVDAALFRQTS